MHCGWFRKRPTDNVLDSITTCLCFGTRLNGSQRLGPNRVHRSRMLSWERRRRHGPGTGGSGGVRCEHRTQPGLCARPGPLGSLEGLSWRCLIHLGCARTQGALGQHCLLPQHHQPSSITSTQSISVAPVCRGDTGPGGAHSQVWPHAPSTACTGADRSSLPQVNRLRSEPGCAGPQDQNPQPGQPPPAVPPRVTGQRAGWPQGEPLATASSGHKG